MQNTQTNIDFSKVNDAPLFRPIGRYSVVPGAKAETYLAWLKQRDQQLDAANEQLLAREQGLAAANEKLAAAEAKIAEAMAIAEATTLKGRLARLCALFA